MFTRQRSTIALVGISIAIALLVGAAPARTRAIPPEQSKQRFALASMPVSAGQAKATVRIFLKCTVGGPGDFPKVTVENNTNSTIPSGTKIHWTVCPGFTRNRVGGGSITLQAALPKAQRISWILGSPSCGGNAPLTPKAWYFK